VGIDNETTILDGQRSMQGYISDQQKYYISPNVFLSLDCKYKKSVIFIKGEVAKLCSHDYVLSLEKVKEYTKTLPKIAFKKAIESNLEILNRTGHTIVNGEFRSIESEKDNRKVVESVAKGTEGKNNKQKAIESVSDKDFVKNILHEMKVKDKDIISFTSEFDINFVAFCINKINTSKSPIKNKAGYIQRLLKTSFKDYKKVMEINFIDRLRS
jgi:hypothetical protein